MFLTNSRYCQGLPTVTRHDRTRRATVAALKLRTLPPATAGEPRAVRAAHDRLDVIAEQRYGDATQFWHIADANTELDSRTAGRARPGARSTCPKT